MKNFDRTLSDLSKHSKKTHFLSSALMESRILIYVSILLGILDFSCAQNIIGNCSLTQYQSCNFYCSPIGTVGYISFSASCTTCSTSTLWSLDIDLGGKRFCDQFDCSM